MHIPIRSVCHHLATTGSVYVALRIGIGVIFTYASVDKVLHPDQFAEIMQDYEILPKMVVNGAALWLAWLEALVGILLIVGVWVRAAGLMVTGLMVVFIVGMSIALTRGIGLHCGCFSTDPGGQARTWLSLWQEGLLLLACLWLTVQTFGDTIRGAEDARYDKRRH